MAARGQPLLEQATRTIFHILDSTANFWPLLNAAIQLLEQERQTSMAILFRREAHVLRQPYQPRPLMPLQSKTLPLPTPVRPVPAKFVTIGRGLSVPLLFALRQAVHGFFFTYQDQVRLASYSLSFKAETNIDI